MREQPNISEDRLCACLFEAFGLRAVALEFLPVGLDMHAGVYRVTDERATPFLLKVKSGEPHRPTFLAPRYLRDQGIEGVVAPLPAFGNVPWATLDTWTVSLYPFIAGDVGWNPPMTENHWRAVGTTLKQIHQVMPSDDLVQQMRAEAFDVAAYAAQARAYDPLGPRANSGGEPGQALRESWIAHQPEIDAMVAAMETLGAAL